MSILLLRANLKFIDFISRRIKQWLKDYVNRDDHNWPSRQNHQNNFEV